MKKILITGTSSGFGKALLKNLFKEFYVICISRRNPNFKKKNIEFYKCDLSNSHALENCLKKIQKRHKYIPYIINNAGIFQTSKVENLKLSAINNFFKVNCFAPALITKKFIRQMKKNNFGRIVNITSGAPLNIAPTGFLYSASKAALNIFTITAAKENLNTNVKINLFSPGQVKTEMMPKAKNNPKNSVKYLKILLDEKKNLFTGKFLWTKYLIPIVPNLKSIDWSKGTAPKKFRLKKI
jgi:3-oxoacyl-[acyl-carrier protein] reductase